MENVEKLMTLGYNSDTVYVDDDWYAGSVMKVVGDIDSYSNKTQYDKSNFQDWEKIEMTKSDGFWQARPIKPRPSKYSYDGGTIDESVAHLLSTPKINLDPYDPSWYIGMQNPE